MTISERDFCSTNKTPNLLPIFPVVAFWRDLPPCISSVIFTCGKPLSSKPVLALVTLSPETITVLSTSAVCNSEALKTKLSFLNLDAVDEASMRNSRFAVLPMIFFAAVVSWTPGNWTTILSLPCRCTMGSDTPSSLTRFRSVIKFCPTA